MKNKVKLNKGLKNFWKIHNIKFYLKLLENNYDKFKENY